MILLDETDVQTALAQHLRCQRKARKWSREALAQRSGVPAPTIKKFELTGQISLRQMLQLWFVLDDMQRLYALTQVEQQKVPKTIAEVLNG